MGESMSESDQTKENTGDSRMGNPSERDRLVESLAMPAILFDQDGAIIIVNPAAKTLFGLGNSALIGQCFDHFVPCPREYQGNVPAYLKDHLHANPNQWQQPVMASKKSGERFALHFSISPLDTELLIVFSNVDEHITDVSNLENEVKEYQSTSRAKSHFLHHMSQELRLSINLLMNVVGETIDRDDMPVKIGEDLDRAFTAGRDLQKAIGEMMDYTQMESDKFEFREITFNFRMVLDDIVDRYQALAHKNNLELATLVSPYVPETVVGDPDRFHQILQSLLNNAFKYTTEGGVTVRASCDVETDTTATIQIEVMDTGSGISDSRCQEIGRGFAEPGIHMTDRFGGMGIGLAICKELVDRMGGKISLRSTEGVGATFIVTLIMQKGEAYESEHCNLANKKMLLVNDSVDDRNKLQAYASEWNINTDIAGCADHAFVMLQTSSREDDNFDFVVIDLHKTYGASLALARSIHASSELQHLKVVLMAADADGLSEASAADQGVDVFIIKPMRKHLVYDALTIAMGRRSNVHHQIVTNNTVREAKEKQAYRALLVEDNEVNQIIAKGALKRLGINTDVTNNGEEAIDAIQDKRYDVVLMDCEMPIMDGFEATRLIRQWEKHENKHIPIIALTANESTECQKSCLEAGMDDFMQKPFRADELEIILSRFVSESRET